MINKNKNKLIFVFGGTSSSIGKGIFSSSLAYLFKNNKQKVLILKLDYYLNLDSKFIDPYENGEVFITYDGKEVDFDIGHYERFLAQDQSAKQSITLGLILQKALLLERQDYFQGKKVDLIKQGLVLVKKRIDFLINNYNPDITIIELGGHIKNFSFEISMNVLQLFSEQNYDLFMFNMIYISDFIEMKRIEKVVQFYQKNSIKMDFCVLRSKQKLSAMTIQKLNQSLKMPENKIFNLPDFYFEFQTVQEILDAQIFALLLKKFNFTNKLNTTLIDEYRNEYALISQISPQEIFNFALIDQYKNKDAYYSIIFSLKQSFLKLNSRINIVHLLPQDLAKTQNYSSLKDVDAIILPGGFGDVGFLEKIMIVKYAREHKIPLLTICYGMQIALIEYFRNVLKLANANTAEISKNKDDVLIFDYLNEDKKIFLGNSKIKLKKDSFLETIYKTRFSDLNLITEKHRHSFVFQKKYQKYLKKDKNLVFSCFSNDSEERILGFEMKNHPFFIGLQFHPELNSKIGQSHPIFDYFAQIIQKRKKLGNWKKKTKA